MYRPGSLPYTLLLGFIFACGSLGTDIFAPAQPAIAEYFEASNFEAQLVMSSYFVGLAIAQLFFGPLSDRIGRRPALRVGLWLFIVSTLIGAFAPNIEFLLFIRFVQGFAAAAGLAIARAIARDKFSGSQLGRTMSYLSLTLSLSPVLLPPLGGALVAHFGWQTTFYVLSALSAMIAIWMDRSIGESLKPELRDRISPLAVFERFSYIATHKAFVGYMLTGGLCFAGLFAYISTASLLFRNQFGVSPDQIGLIIGATFIGHSLGAFSGGRLALRIGSEKLITFGAVICFGAGIGMLFFDQIDALNVESISILMTAYLFGAGWVYPQSLAGALHPFPRFAGAASALMGFFVMLTSGLTGALVGFFYDETTGALASFVAIVSTLSLSVFLVMVRKRSLAKHRTID